MKFFYLVATNLFNCVCRQRKMDIQDQYLDIQLCDKHLIYIQLKYLNIKDIHINLFQYYIILIFILLLLY